MADPITATFLIATAVSAGSSIMGGISANKAAKQEAGFLQEQGRIAQQEADREAALHAEDVRKFQRNQAVAFTKNGVSLAGSPLLVLDETTSKGQEEVDSIVRSGAAERTLYNQRGVMAKNQGRAALIGGFAQGFSTAASGFSTYSSATRTQALNKPAPALYG